jgi:hypothetical protein
MEKVNRYVGHTSGADGSSHLGLVPGGDLFQPPVQGTTEAPHLDLPGLVLQVGAERATNSRAVSESSIS